VINGYGCQLQQIKIQDTVMFEFQTKVFIVYLKFKFNDVLDFIWQPYQWQLIDWLGRTVGREMAF
jgi:hypothetical protein